MSNNPYSLKSEELEERLLAPNPTYEGVGDVDVDGAVNVRRKDPMSSRTKYMVVTAVGVMVAIIGIVALAGGFQKDASNGGTQQSSMSSTSMSFMTVQSTCTNGCVLNGEALGVPQTCPSLSHMHATLGDVKLTTGTWTFVNASKIRRDMTAPSPTYLKYTGDAVVRNVTFSSSVYVWFVNDTVTSQSSPEIAINMAPVAGARPAWVNTSADHGLVLQMVGLHATAIPVVDESATISYTSKSTATSAAGVMISAKMSASSVPAINSLLIAAGQVAADTVCTVTGSLLPALNLTVTVPNVKLGSVMLTDTRVVIQQPAPTASTPAPTETVWMVGEASIAISGQPSLNWTVDSNVTDALDLRMVATTTKPTTFSGDGMAVTVTEATLMADISTHSVWACPQPDWEQRCPVGWVTVSATECVDVSSLTCENLTLFGPTYPASVHANPRLTNCSNVDCDCECLNALPWPGIDNATQAAWQRQGCPAITNAAQSNCSGVFNFSTEALKKSFVARCPMSPFPCSRQVVASLTGKIQFGDSDAATTFTADIDTTHADMIGSLTLADMPLGSDRVMLTHASVALGANTSVHVSGEVALKVVGAATAGSVVVNVSYVDGAVVARGVATDVPLPHGASITAANVAVTAGAHGSDVTVMINGDLTLGEQTFTASASYNSSQGLGDIDLVLAKTQSPTALSSTSSAVATLCGSSCSMGQAPLPATSITAVGGMQLADAKLTYASSTRAIHLSATVDFSDGIGQGDATLRLVVAPQNISVGGWSDVGFAVEVVVDQDVTFKAFVPTAVGAPTGPMIQGNFLFSTFVSSAVPSFPASWYAAAVAVVNTPGASFSAKVPVAGLDELGFPAGVWAPTKYALIQSTFGAATTDDGFTFKLTLPTNGVLAKGVVLSDGVLDVVAGGTDSITGTLAITAVTGPAVSVVVVGSLTNEVFTVKGTAGPWTMKPGITMTSASVNFTWGHGTPAHGVIAGDVNIDGATVAASLELPGLTGAIEVDVPHLHLGHGVSLVNITLDAATGTAPADGVHVHGVLTINVPGRASTLDVVAGAAFVGGAYTISATMPTWELEDGIVINDVSVVVTGMSNSTNATTAVFSGSAVTPIGSVAVKTSLPFSVDGFTIDFTNWTLGDGVTLTSGSIVVKDAGTTVSGITTVVATSKQVLTFTTIGSFPVGGGAVLTGDMTGTWQAGSKLSVSDVKLNLVVNKTAAKGLTVVGNIAGEIDFAGTTVDVDMAIPVDEGTSTAEIPTLRLDSRVTLHNLDLTFTDTDGVTSISFSGQCDIETGATSPPITVAVTGTSTPTSLTFTGSVDDWTVHIGKDAFVLHSLALAMSKTGTVVAGSVSATTTMGDTNLNASIAFPTPTGVDGVVIKLALLVTPSSPLTPTKVLGAVSTSVVGDATGAASAVMGAPLDTVTMTLITSPASFNLVATTTLFGHDSLDLDISVRQTTVAPTTNTSTPVTPSPSTVWGYAVSVRLAAPFTTSDVLTGAGSFIDDFQFSSGGVRVADPPAAPVEGVAFWSTMPAHVTTVDNVLLVGVMAFDDLATKMSTAALWAGSDGEKSTDLIAWAAFGFGGAGADVALNITLPDDLPIGDDFMINNGTVLVQEAEPHFDLITVATIKLGDLSPLTMECVVVESDTFFNITGVYVHDYNISVAGHGIDATGVSFSGAISKVGQAFTGVIRGTVVLATFTFDLSVVYPYDGGSGVEIDLNAHTTLDTSLTLSDLATSMVPGTTLHTFGNIVGSPLSDVSLAITTSPVSVQVYAFAEGLFHVSERLSVKMVLTDQTHFWSWAFGIGIGAPFKLSDVASDWKLLSSLSALNSGGIVVSSYPQQFVIPGSPSLLCVEGVTVFGDFPLDNDLAEISKVTGITSLQLEGSYSFESSRLAISADISVDWHIGDFLYFQNMSLFVDLPGTKGQGAFDLGIGGYFNVRVGKPGTANNMLDFDAKLMVGDVGFSMEAGLNTPWNDPFGIHGVTVLDTEIELGLSFASFMPYLFGVSGGLRIGNDTGSATVFIDVAEPEDFVLAGNLTHFSLAGAIETLTFNAIPTKMADTIFDVTLNNVSMMINLDPETFYFNHQIFRPGFEFAIGEFVLWFLKGSASIALTRDYMALNVAVQPFSVCDGVLKVGGMDSAGAMTDTPFELGGAIGHLSTMDYFDMSAEAKFLDIMTVGAYINISAADGFTFALKYDMPLFSFFMNLSLTHEPAIGADVDFSLYADLGLALPEKVEVAVTKFLETVKTTVDSKLTQAQAALTKWQAVNGDKITQDEATIAAKQASIKTAEAAHQASIELEIQGLTSDNATLNSYYAQKESYEKEKEDCHHWWDAGCDAHNAWCDAKVAWADTKIALYKGYVDVKRDALEAEGWVLGAAADVDEALNPEIDELRLAIAAHAVLAAAEDALTNAVKIAEEGINIAIKGLIDFEGAVLGLRSLIVECDSVAGLAKGDKCSLAVTGNFLGKPYDWQVDFVFPPDFDNIVQSLWTTIKADFHL
eukprot:m.228060 g.228060  ORF g.228060 m.228060 type:complete len:2491 (+) comp33536_c0_seq1:135-7607(+)